MGRVGARRRTREAGGPAQAREGPSLRTVAVHDVRLDLGEPSAKAGEGHEIRRARMAFDRRCSDAESQTARNLR